jgi:hypothetical protein
MRVAQKHFCFAQEEEAIVSESKIHPGKNTSLRFGVHVHQSISADKQIKLRDGRILDKIVPAEDNRAP